jgi:hypothetical protein
VFYPIDYKLYMGDRPKSPKSGVFSRFFKKGDNGTRVFFVVHGTPINLCCSNSPPFRSTEIGGGVQVHVLVWVLTLVAPGRLVY